MKGKAAAKAAVDVLMTLALFFVTGYQFWGEAPHEWAGTAMFALFIVHHILNTRWHKALFKGRYSAMRVLILVTDCFVLASVLIQMYSGIVMSRCVFAFLPSAGGMANARRLHILGAYWGFVFMSLHIGLHWNAVLGFFRKASGLKGVSRARGAVAFIAGAAVAVYGAYAFTVRKFPVYMFLGSEFVFLDYSEPAALFYADYTAVMGLCVFIAHCVTKLLRGSSKKHAP